MRKVNTMSFEGPNASSGSSSHEENTSICERVTVDALTRVASTSEFDSNSSTTGNIDSSITGNTNGDTPQTDSSDSGTASDVHVSSNIAPTRNDADDESIDTRDDPKVASHAANSSKSVAGTKAGFAITTANAASSSQEASDPTSGSEYVGSEAELISSDGDFAIPDCEVNVDGNSLGCGQDTALSNAGTSLMLPPLMSCQSFASHTGLSPPQTDTYTTEADTDMTDREADTGMTDDQNVVPSIGRTSLQLPPLTSTKPHTSTTNNHDVPTVLSMGRSSVTPTTLNSHSALASSLAPEHRTPFENSHRQRAYAGQQMSASMPTCHLGTESLRGNEQAQSTTFRVSSLPQSQRQIYERARRMLELRTFARLKDTSLTDEQQMRILDEHEEAMAMLAKIFSSAREYFLGSNSAQHSLQSMSSQSLQSVSLALSKSVNSAEVEQQSSEIALRSMQAVEACKSVSAGNQSYATNTGHQLASTSHMNTFRQTHCIGTESPDVHQQYLANLSANQVTQQLAQSLHSGVSDMRGAHPLENNGDKAHLARTPKGRSSTPRVGDDERPLWAMPIYVQLARDPVMADTAFAALKDD